MIKQVTMSTSQTDLAVADDLRRVFCVLGQLAYIITLHNAEGGRTDVTLSSMTGQTHSHAACRPSHFQFIERFTLGSERRGTEAPCASVCCASASVS